MVQVRSVLVRSFVKIPAHATGRCQFFEFRDDEILHDDQTANAENDRLDQNETIKEYDLCHESVQRHSQAPQDVAIATIQQCLQIEPTQKGAATGRNGKGIQSGRQRCLSVLLYPVARALQSTGLRHWNSTSPGPPLEYIKIDPARLI